MFPNETVQAYIAPDCRACARFESNNMLLLSQSLSFLLTALKIVLPIYPLVLLLMLSPALQRHLIYCHRWCNILSLSSKHDTGIDSPESKGFLRNQVTTHLIPTSDGETLYSWLIVPLGVYTRHETVLTKSWSADEAREIALSILRSDPKATLAVYMHGSGSNLATQWRCEAYRNLSSGSPNHLYLLAFDYRGFGKSPGSPSEEGLIVDATSVLSWVEKKLCIPRARVLVIGHSLGAAVATAAIERIVRKNCFAEFAGLILCSGMNNIPKLAVEHRLFGLPILKPLVYFKHSRNWIESRFFVDTWNSEARLRDLVKTSEVIRLSIIHADDDDRIPSATSDIMYSSCVDELQHIATPIELSIDLGTLGHVREAKIGGRIVRNVSLTKGGHNVYMQWHTIGFEVTRLLLMTGALE